MLWLPLLGQEALAGEPSEGLLSQPERFDLALPDTPKTIAVVYPELQSPYREIFARIVAGVKSQSKARVIAYPLEKTVDIRNLPFDFRRLEVKVIIALGRQGLKAVAGIGKEFGIVAGGVVSIANADALDFPVFSLTPDPALLFGRIHRLMPETKRVFVVHNPQHSDWLMRLARAAAHKQGFALMAIEAPNLQAASQAYLKLFAEMTPQRDVLWLLPDTIVSEESIILPLILEESWNRNLAVFSSSLDHVRRGALFALFPDEIPLGKRLALAAQRYATVEAALPGIMPLREVRGATNLRTARHLGLGLDFDLRTENFAQNSDVFFHLP